MSQGKFQLYFPEGTFNTCTVLSPIFKFLQRSSKSVFCLSPKNKAKYLGNRIVAHIFATEWFL